MAFKLDPPYSLDNTPIYRTLDADGILGVANKNCTMRVHKDLTGEELEKVIDHERVHVEQIKKGDLDYDDNYMYWKGKKIKRSENMDGNPALKHEQESDNLAIQKRIKKKYYNGKF